MTNKLLFSDNASTTLAAPIAYNSPSLQVVSGGGALFPVLAANQAFICTLIKSGAPTIREVILVEGHASGSDNFTGLVRDLRSTGALGWNAGDIVEMRPTAEAMSALPQAIDIQSWIYNSAQDIGSANAYKTILTPSVNGRSAGFNPIFFFVQHPNTGSCTLTDNIGTVGLLTADGEPLRPGDLQQYSIVAAFFDGASYRCLGVKHLAFSQMNGPIANGQVPQSAVLQHEAALVIAFTQLTGQLLAGQIPANYNLPGSPTTTTQAVGDSATRIATTAFVNPASLLATNGFFKRADGHIVQAGQCNPNGGLITVTLPQAFPNAFQAVVGNSTGRPTQCNCVIASNSQFTISNTGGQSYWMAMGY
jgi:hypothetical protein